MRRGQAAEVVALHRAREALTDGGARDVDGLAGLEQVRLELGARLELGVLVGAQPELDERLARSNGGLGVMTGNSLRIELRTASTVRDLHGSVAILVLRLHMRDAVRQNLNHGDGHCLAGVREHARHADLTADQSDSHVLFPQHTPTLFDWRAGPLCSTTDKGKVLKTTEDSRALKQRYADLEWSWN